MVDIDRDLELVREGNTKKDSTPDGHEFTGSNGKLALIYNCRWVGILGGEDGDRGTPEAAIEYALFDVVPKPSGGYAIRYFSTLTKREIIELKLKKRLHSNNADDRDLGWCEYTMADNRRCRLVTLA